MTMGAAKLRKLQQQKLAIARAKANAKEKGLPDPFPEMNDNGEPTPEYQKRLDRIEKKEKQPKIPEKKPETTPEPPKTPKKRGGYKKPSITEEKIRLICNGVELCHSEKASAIMAGVKYNTFLEWKKKGRKAKSGLYVDLIVGIDEAKQKAIAYLESNIRIASIKDWKAADRLLQRLDKEWQKSQDIRVRGDIKSDVTIDGQVNLSEMTSEQLDQYLTRVLGELGHHKKDLDENLSDKEK